MAGQPPSPMPPQPQPFRFWLPYRSNVELSWEQPQPPPWLMPPSSPTQLPRNEPPPPPTPAVAAVQTAPARTAGQETLIQSDQTEESETVPIQTMDSSQGAKPSKLDFELTLSSPPPTDQEQSSSRHMYNHGSDTKISISGFPRAGLFDGARPPYRREIDDGLKSLACGETPAPRPRGQGYRVITLTGHNVGASMVLGSKEAPRNAEPETLGSARPAVAANVNSNVQSVNNSAVEASTCNAGDPGVHVGVKNARKETMVAMDKEEKPEEPVNRLPLVVTSSQEKSRASDDETTVRPMRRPCLRALMMESESDTEGPWKPRWHGCRFGCGERKEKDTEDHTPAPETASNGGGGGRNAEEGGK